MGAKLAECQSEQLSDPRSSWTGSFRILLHKAEMEVLELAGADNNSRWMTQKPTQCDSQPKEAAYTNNVNARRFPKSQRMPSKLCILL